MLDQALIRTRLLLMHEPGMLVESTLRAIIDETERYAKERVEAATKGTLFEQQCTGSTESRDSVLEIVQGIRSDLEALRSRA